MQIFSFIPLVFFAVTSLAVAAPAVDSTNSNHLTALSTRDDSPVQTIINIISDTASQLEPLGEQLASITSANNIDGNQFSSVVSQITSVISASAGELRSAAQGVDFTKSDLAVLNSHVNRLLDLVSSILDNLIPGLKALLFNAGTNVVLVVTVLLVSISNLVNFLQPWATLTVIGILLPTINLLDFILDTVADILGLPH